MEEVGPEADMRAGRQLALNVFAPRPGSLRIRKGDMADGGGRGAGMAWVNCGWNSDQLNGVQQPRAPIQAGWSPLSLYSACLWDDGGCLGGIASERNDAEWLRCSGPLAQHLATATTQNLKACLGGFEDQISQAAEKVGERNDAEWLRWSGPLAQRLATATTQKACLGGLEDHTSQAAEKATCWTNRQAGISQQKCWPWGKWGTTNCVLQRVFGLPSVRGLIFQAGPTECGSKGWRSSKIHTGRRPRW
ncbi:hypothetical protein BU15DRAFT_65373 [Melanogaster broomeanus]|nr:hypothetical protein BU15DRAFT_65373 [Melanogaster broomeanus]